MTKSELILRIGELNPHLYHRDVERIVATIFEEIATALARGDRGESIEPNALWVAIGTDLVFRWPSLQLAAGVGRLSAISSDVGPDPVAITTYCVPRCR